MTETIHVFDEFNLPPGQITDAYNLKKRLRLEPLIYNILRQKYAAIWRENWHTYTPPVRAERCVVIIERRIHENLELLLHNVAYYAPGWAIAIVCSDVNYEFCREIIAPHASRIRLMPLFEGSPERDEARNEYNTLLKSAEFYDSLPWTNILIAQTDSYLRKPVPNWDYDLVACPTGWNQKLVGGISYRNCEAMANLCRTYQVDTSGEDVFCYEGAIAQGLRVPSYEEAIPVFCESVLHPDPIGVHQWWTYFHTHTEYAEPIFHALLTCELRDPKSPESAPLEECRAHPPS